MSTISQPFATEIMTTGPALVALMSRPRAHHSWQIGPGFVQNLHRTSVSPEILLRVESRPEDLVWKVVDLGPLGFAPWGFKDWKLVPGDRLMVELNGAADLVFNFEQIRQVQTTG